MTVPEAPPRAVPGAPTDTRPAAGLHLHAQRDIALTAGRDIVAGDVHTTIHTLVVHMYAQPGHTDVVAPPALDAMPGPDKLGLLIAGTLAVRSERRLAQYSELKVAAEIQVGLYHAVRNDDAEAPGKTATWFRELLARRDPPTRASRRLLVLGDAGAGKTTSCHWAVMSLARDVLRAPEDTHLPIPIYLDAGGFRPQPDDDPWPFLVQEVRRLLDIPTDQATSDPMRDAVRLLVEARRCLFVIDGLNEVGAAQTAALAAVVQRIAEFGPQQHQLLATSRRFDFRETWEARLRTLAFSVLEILELDSDGVTEFVVRQMTDIGAIEAQLTANGTPQLADVQQLLARLKRADEVLLPATLEPFVAALRVADITGTQTLAADLLHAQELLQTLRDPHYRRLLWLSQNPATLADIVGVFRARGKLPASRVQLLRLALGRRLDRGPGTHPATLDPGLRWRIAEQVALCMVDHGLRLPRPTAEAAILPWLPPAPDAAAAASSALATHLREHVVLVAPDEHAVTFYRQPYQEFFVASWLADRIHELGRTGRPLTSDPQVHAYLLEPSKHRYIALASGLIEPAQAGALVGAMWPRRAMRRLAASCVPHVEAFPEHQLRGFLEHSKRAVLFWAFIPDRIPHIIVVASIILLGVLMAGSPLWVELSRQAVAAALAQVPAMTRGIAAALDSGLVALMIATLAIACRRASIRVFEELPSPLPTLLAIAGNKPRPWPWLVLVLASAPLVCAGVWGPASSMYRAANFLAGLTCIVVLYRSWNVLLLPALDRLNVRIEDAIARRWLVPQLEILRTLGEDAASTIAGIREHFASDAINARLRGIIERTWTPSPRTPLQVIQESRGHPERQGEMVEVLGNILTEGLADPQLVHQACASLLDVLATSQDPDIRLGALRKLLAASLPAETTTKLRDVLLAIETEANPSRQLRAEVIQALVRFGSVRLFGDNRRRLRRALIVLIVAVVLAVSVLFVGGDELIDLFKHRSSEG